MEREVTLAKGVTACIGEATGHTEMVALSVRIKMEPHLSEFEGLDANYLFQQRFSDVVAQTVWLKGRDDFELPDLVSDGETLADAYRAWLKLPKRLLNRWREEIEWEGDLNDPDLLPPEQLSDQKKAIPPSTKSAGDSGNT